MLGHVLVCFSLCSGMDRFCRLTELQFHDDFWAAGEEGFERNGPVANPDIDLPFLLLLHCSVL